MESLVHPGASADCEQVANPSVAALYEDALVYEFGTAITSSGALTAYSGAKMGRSPLDKRIVKEPGSEKEVWWGPVNKPMSPEVSGSVHIHCPLACKFLILLSATLRPAECARSFGPLHVMGATDCLSRG